MTRNGVILQSFTCNGWEWCNLPVFTCNSWEWCNPPVFTYFCAILQSRLTCVISFIVIPKFLIKLSLHCLLSTLLPAIQHWLSKGQNHFHTSSLLFEFSRPFASSLKLKVLKYLTSRLGFSPPDLTRYNFYRFYYFGVN